MQDDLGQTPFEQTPWQTTGPFFHFALPWKGGGDLVSGPGLDHPAIEVGGRVFDGAGTPVPDALIETWQADPDGRMAPPGFVGFGRTCTDEHGDWRVHTLRPGSAAGPNGRPQAPHIAIGVLGRGLNKRLVTRAYFADAPENADDAILALVPPARRGTLLARLEGSLWRFNIVLQGERETVFFDI
ncbi:protocatechuate 3,4-dioxygenase subunit alpha [Lichenicoccus sp.]|uniref:protocatechuate 3,4-dioxygenase subunit alpha n=1 Tax=Lichenicoccus sp. TaxID=2781899 RepID=UPI003D09EE53